MQWRDALDDPSALSMSELSVRVLLLAHPRADKTPLSASISIAKALHLFEEEPRQDLYNLNEETFLRLSRFEPQRAWGLLGWIGTT